ncbi:MAG: hypothetical protein ACLRXC_06710 [[Clostridium] leptum]
MPIIAGKDYKNWKKTMEWQILCIASNGFFMIGFVEPKGKIKNGGILMKNCSRFLLAALTAASVTATAFAQGGRAVRHPAGGLCRQLDPRRQRCCIRPGIPFSADDR